MDEFYKTSGGRKLVDVIMPDIARQLKRIADELRLARMMKRRELGLESPADVAKEFIEGDETGKTLKVDE